jgi:hypothetical protein
MVEPMANDKKTAWYSLLFLFIQSRIRIRQFAHQVGITRMIWIHDLAVFLVFSKPNILMVIARSQQDFSAAFIKYAAQTFPDEKLCFTWKLSLISKG